MNDLMPMSKRDKTEFLGASLSWKKALSDAQINLFSLCRATETRLIIDTVKKIDKKKTSPSMGS